VSSTYSDNSRNTDAILSVVMTTFLPHIRRRASAAKSAGIESDDIVQEGLIGIYDAIESYSESGGAGFSTYAFKCIDNRINSAFRAASRLKHLPLVDYASLSDENIENAAGCDYSPEDIAVVRDDCRLLIETIENSLSRFEKNVLLLHLEGYGYQVIADALASTPKSVDNALQRARRKLKRSRP